MSMNDSRKKDALTDLVGEVGTQPDTRPENNGTVNSPSGERVELGSELALAKVYSTFLGFFKALTERSTLEQKIIRENAERELKELAKKKTK